MRPLTPPVGLADLAHTDLAHTDLVGALVRAMPAATLGATP